MKYWNLVSALACEKTVNWENPITWLFHVMLVKFPSWHANLIIGETLGPDFHSYFFGFGFSLLLGVFAYPLLSDAFFLLYALLNMHRKIVRRQARLHLLECTSCTSKCTEWIQLWMRYLVFTFHWRGLGKLLLLINAVVWCCSWQWRRTLKLLFLRDWKDFNLARFHN